MRADTVGIEHVAAGETGSADRAGRDVGALDDVVERGAGIGLRLLPAVPVHHDLDRHADQIVVDLHVVVGADRVVLVERPVETGRAGIPVDGRVLGHHVVATLGVVVVLTGLTDEDVVAGCGFGGIVEERRAVIALQQILAGATLDPVVATVTEDGVRTLARR